MKVTHKKCGKCKKDLPSKMFCKEKASPDGLAYQCKPCDHAYYKVYSAKNKKKIKFKNGPVRIKRKRELVLFMLTYLKEHPCVDCGETNLVCLEFDHVRGKKYHSISYLIMTVSSMETILKEIAKCEVRCANCHKKKTSIQQGWYNYIDLDNMTIKHNIAKPKPHKKKRKIGK